MAFACVQRSRRGMNNYPLPHRLMDLTIVAAAVMLLLGIRHLIGEML